MLQNANGSLNPVCPPLTAHNILQYMTYSSLLILAWPKQDIQLYCVDTVSVRLVFLTTPSSSSIRRFPTDLGALRISRSGRTARRDIAANGRAVALSTPTSKFVALLLGPPDVAWLRTSAEIVSFLTIHLVGSPHFAQRLVTSFPFGSCY